MLDDSPGAVYDDRRIDMLFFKKINAGLSLKLIFSGLAALTLFSTFSSCHIYNLSLEDFLKEWTETARVAESRISPEPVYKDSYAHIASGEDTLITYKLVNPQNYDLDETLFWEDGISPASGTDYYFEQDANDKNILYLTLKKDFLEGLDGTGTKISPSLTLKERKSGRSFGTYSVPALVNSAPPAVILPVVLRTGNASGKETYVICFNLPEMTGIHQDVKTLEISSPYKKTYTITPEGNLSGGETELTTTYNESWQPVKDAHFIGDINNRFVGIVTDVPLSGDLTSFTLSLVDEYGLSTSVTASTRASKLPSVTASLTGGIITINGTVEFSNSVPGATLVLESENWVGVECDGNPVPTPVPGKIEGTGTITLKFTEPGTYNITAYAQMRGAADSDKVTFTYKVVDDSTVYVSEFGDNNNPGTEDKPVATLQKALELLNDAGFTEGKIVVTGTVQTREVKISVPGDSTTGSVTTLTVMGGSAGGTLKNEKGRVFTIGTGGSLTLGENITLTGTNDTGKGGAVYVNGGTFTMKADSKITKSIASYGGGVYVDSNGTFTMGGGAITENSASIDESGGGNSGGGVCISNGTFTMSGDAVISKNTAGSSGGGVYIFSDGTFTMEDGSKITDGQAAFGGGVYVAGGTFNMNDTATLQGNKATDHGGGVHILSGGIFTMNGGTIGGTAANTATYGGGVFVSGGTFDMNNGTISGNSASGIGASGGGVCISGGEFTMRGDAVISKNTAGSSGGGVFVSDSGKFTMEGGTIGGPEAGTDNFAQYGGGVYVNGGEFEMTGTAILQGNVARDHGGGVYIHNGTFTMSGGTISGNQAAQNGGGVYVGDGTFTMTGGTISANNASVTGGGVYVSSTGSFTLDSSSAGSSPVIYGNTKKGSPNNVYLDNGKTLFINGILKKTEGAGNIGISMATPGVFTAGWSSSGSTDSTFFFSDDASYKIKLDSGECELVTNDSEVEYKVSGSTSFGTFAEALAAVNTTAGGTITLLTNIDGNNAVFKDASSHPQPITFTGGAKASPIVLDLNGHTIDRALGTAQEDGTVISVSGALMLKDSTGRGKITGGNNNNRTNSGTWGGGVCVQGGAFFTMEGGNISCNLSEIGGGGVYVCNDGSFTMTGGTIGGSDVNDANKDKIGGGVAVTADGTFTMSGTAVISANKASNGSGGGVYSAADFTMTGGTIGGTGGGSPNSAENGGGVYMINSKKITMDGGAISGNTATTNGGGLYLYDGSTAEIGKNTSGSAPQISSNTATDGGGIYLGTSAKVELVYGTIGGSGSTTGNTATDKGGGVYAGSGSTFIMDGESAIIENNKINSVFGRGGGIYSEGGTLEMKNGSITDNNVGSSGGGVYISSTTFTMTDGEISRNSASFGGGVTVGSAGTFIISSPAVVSGNTISSVGGENVYVNVSTGGKFIDDDNCVTEGVYEQ